MGNKPNVSGFVASDDTQMIAEVLAGDGSRFRTIVERYRGPVFRFALNLIHDEHDSEDITQDVFVAAFRHLATYDASRATFTTWLLTITRRRCLNYLKRKRPGTHEEHLLTIEQTADTQSRREEFWHGLDVALRTLPLEQKAAFVLAEIEELPYSEIANIEQTTVGTIKSRVYRAKQKLRDVMAPAMGKE